MGRMLELVPEYKDLVFETYLATASPVLDTFEYGIPRGSVLAQDYFSYLLANGMPADIRKAWEWLEAQSLVDDRLSGDYTDFLLRKNEYVLAGEIWKRTAGRRDGRLSQAQSRFNGGFELEPIRCASPSR
jgi:hypothetical protein